MKRSTSSSTKFMIGLLGAAVSLFAQQPNVPVLAEKVAPRVFLQAESYGNTWKTLKNQSMEMGKDFDKDCPAVHVTTEPEMADYTIHLNHIEVGLFLIRDNQFQIVKKNGDVLHTKEGRSIRGGSLGACDMILADWSANSFYPLPPSPSPVHQPTSTPPVFLRNADILWMQDAGFSPKIIVTKIHASSGVYEVGTDDLWKLKISGLPESVITAMIEAPNPR